MTNRETFLRYNIIDRFVHVVHLSVCILLYLTGLGLYSKSLFFLVNIFGGVDNARSIHHVCGVIFIITSLLIGLMWWKEGKWTESDFEWVKVLGGYLKKGAHPPASGKINAGQKMFFYATVICGIVLGMTGLELWFSYSFPAWLSRISIVVHDLSMIGLGMFLVAHIYLSTIGAPGSFSAMLIGRVTRAWAFTHHELWAREMKQKNG